MSKTAVITEEKVAVPEVMTIKNFRSNGDIENFYCMIIDEMTKHRLSKCYFVRCQPSVAELTHIKKNNQKWYGKWRNILNRLNELHLIKFYFTICLIATIANSDKRILSFWTVLVLLNMLALNFWAILFL